MTIVYEGDLTEVDTPPHIVRMAQRVEDVCVELLATEVRVYSDTHLGRFVITTDQSYRESGDIITTIRTVEI